MKNIFALGLGVFTCAGAFSAEAAPLSAFTATSSVSLKLVGADFDYDDNGTGDGSIDVNHSWWDDDGYQYSEASGSGSYDPQSYSISNYRDLDVAFDFSWTGEAGPGEGAARVDEYFDRVSTIDFDLGCDIGCSPQVTYTFQYDLLAEISTLAGSDGTEAGGTVTSFLHVGRGGYGSGDVFSRELAASASGGDNDPLTQSGTFSVTMTESGRLSIWTGSIFDATARVAAVQQQPTPAAVPLPLPALLLGAGVLGLGLLRRRQA